MARYKHIDTSKGVIQRYTGVAAVDDRHQIIVAAQAHGTGSEQELLVPVVAAIAAELREHSLVTADAGYHAEAGLKALAEQNIPALITDNGMRQRDERFKDQAKHKTQPHPARQAGQSAPQQEAQPHGSRCAARRRSTRSGSSTAWYTTSRSSRTTVSDRRAKRWKRASHA